MITFFPPVVVKVLLFWKHEDDKQEKTAWHVELASVITAACSDELFALLIGSTEQPIRVSSLTGKFNTDFTCNILYMLMESIHENG